MVNEAGVPCTACRYCLEHCPQGLDIPQLLAIYNEYCFTGGGWLANMRLGLLDADKRPAACLACDSCAAVCPQSLNISAALADFAAKLKK